jgi:hypothetical protein
MGLPTTSPGNGSVAFQLNETLAIPAAREFLSLAGIGHRQLFPRLYGLAKSIKERFDLNRPPADLRPKANSEETR